MTRAKFNLRESLVVKVIGWMFSRIVPNPNIWTIVSLVPAGFGFWALCVNNLLAALILFLIAGVIDAIDGLVARVAGRVSSLGAFLDGIVDRYVEILLYLGLLFYLNNTEKEFLWPSFGWIIILIFGAVMTPYIRAYADHRKAVTNSDVLKKMGGLLERPKRLGLIYLGMFLSLFWPNLLIYFIAAAAILANLTALQRIWFVVSFARERRSV